MSNEPVEDRIRARAAGPRNRSTPAEAASMFPRGRRWLDRRRILVSIVVLLCVLLGVARLVNVAQRSPAGSARSGSQTAIWGTWRIQSLWHEDDRVDLAARGAVMVWRFERSAICDSDDFGCVPGPRVRGFDGCNQFARSIDATTSTIRWSDKVSQTLAACRGDIHDAMHAFFAAGSASYSLAEDSLRVDADGVLVTFVAIR